jgi:hypothetical protein
LLFVWAPLLATDDVFLAYGAADPPVICACERFLLLLLLLNFGIILF